MRLLAIDDKPAWLLTGNVGTNPGTNFIGTTDEKDLSFRTNNKERMRLYSTGQLVISDADPTPSAESNTILTVKPTTNTYRNAISIPMSGASSTAYAINVSSATYNSRGYFYENTSTSTSNVFYGAGAQLSKTNIVSGYLGYRNSSGLSYGIYGINGTNGTYTTNANAWAALIQGRAVISGESSPTSPLGVDLEIQNTTTGTGNPATLSMRQTTQESVSGKILARLNFGDNYTTDPQAQIQVLRDAAASSASDMPTAITFSTTTDGTSTLNERMRITNSGNVGIGDASPVSLLTVGDGDKFQVNSSGNLVKINNVTYSWPSSQGGASTFLQNDNNGNLSWATFSETDPTAWKITGNSNITDGTHFLGTTNDVPLTFKINNTIAGKLSTSNTTYGYQSGYSMTSSTGTNNTIIGNETGYNLSNSAASENTFIGRRAGYFMTTGKENVAIGFNALYCYGGGGMGTWPGGNGNVAVGKWAMFNPTSGDYNVAVGYDAYSLPHTGSYNVFIGYSADGESSYNPSNSVGLGAYSEVRGSNAVAIGYRAYAPNDNTIILGGIKGVNGATATSNVGIGTTSPSQSAALDVTSTNRGILVPRMTTNKRDSITSPENSLIIFNTTSTCFESYSSTSTSWEPIYCQCGNGKNDKWTKKADFNYAANGPVFFAIGSKVYVGLGTSDGNNGRKDFWEYNPSTNTWTQKADFTGAGRWAPIFFAIGNYGYVGGGFNGSSNYSDFYMYDPSTNTWTAKANILGDARNGSATFTIGNKAYVCGGNASTAFYFVYEYDPNNNNWTQKSNIGGSLNIKRAYMPGFAIGNLGYIGTGNDGSSDQKDFWQYNPSTDTWTQKADFGGGVRNFAVGFSIGNKGYMGMGSDGSSDKKDIWEYDPSTNTWTKKMDFPGNARSALGGTSIGSKGYIGLGVALHGGGSRYNDFWEYCP